MQSLYIRLNTVLYTICNCEKKKKTKKEMHFSMYRKHLVPTVNINYFSLFGYYNNVIGVRCLDKNVSRIFVNYSYIH